MRTNSTNIGETIRLLRKAREISKSEMAEMIGISISHLEKIEAGTRRPGIDTYQKILKVVGADMVIRNGAETVQEQCAEKIEKILMKSTESQAVFMTKVVESMAQNMELVV